MKKPLLLSFLLVLSCGAVAQITFGVRIPAGRNTSRPGGLSNADVVAGLKEALDNGAEQSVLHGSALDGFWKSPRIRIPFPAEAEKMKSTLVSVGMTQQVEDFERTLNRAAEEATKEALVILRDAILGMSVGDGFAILKGGEGAATNYLSEKTGASLIERFLPIVHAANEKVALTSYWTPLANGYNTAGLFTGAKAVDPDLDRYVTQKAIDGLFVLIADEEARIRMDPAARTSDLLRRVFGN